MRKIEKQKILDFIESLYQAQVEIEEAFKQKNLASVQKMLAECQEFAAALGENIEKLEGGKHVAVSFIEEYCEDLFYIFQNLRNYQDNVKKVNKILRKSLLKIENSVKNDICVTKEIVFFPYKASMWDSLESIYLATKETADVNTYCIPIPYYDLNVDGSFGQMHYEGRQYPKNIEIIDWQTYDFENRRPDEIYIHNPYDDWNLVTSVHPRFYSSNLKKYTDQLIYLPYFVMGEIDPNDQDTISRINHFCFLPGIIYADKVIVESESIRKIYINEYIKAAKESGLTGCHIDRKYLESKIQGKGSPKYKKILSIKREDVEIPEEWLDIIEKEDGCWKKIVLYNTTIKALLDNGDKALKKIKSVLCIFKEYRENIALLWRPHPLLESTIKALRPILFEEYKKIVENFKKEGWGIFDDTADMNRAVVLSNAYYGDTSSVLQLYKKINKPAMIVYYGDDSGT